VVRARTVDDVVIVRVGAHVRRRRRVEQVDARLDLVRGLAGRRDRPRRRIQRAAVREARGERRAGDAGEAEQEAAVDVGHLYSPVCAKSKAWALVEIVGEYEVVQQPARDDRALRGEVDPADVFAPGPARELAVRRNLDAADRRQEVDPAGVLAPGPA